jgi:tetrahydromethanopterin S-methyltransferase subunit E
MLKYLGSNPISIATTVTGLIAVAFPLLEQYQKGALSAWMLGAGLAGIVFARLTDENWVGKVRSTIDEKPY